MSIISQTSLLVSVLLRLIASPSVAFGCCIETGDLTGPQKNYWVHRPLPSLFLIKFSLSKYFTSLSISLQAKILGAIPHFFLPPSALQATLPVDPVGSSSRMYLKSSYFSPHLCYNPNPVTHLPLDLLQRPPHQLPCPHFCLSIQRIFAKHESGSSFTSSKPSALTY